MKKYIVIATVVALSFMFYTVTYGSLFSDIKSTDWFYSAVLENATMGTMNGDGTGKFRPNDPVTRAELAQVISNMSHTQVFDFDTRTIEAIAGAMPYVAFIESQNGTGSGVLVTRNQIVTNAHVVGEQTTIDVVLGDRLAKGNVIRKDDVHDLALIQVSDNAFPSPVGISIQPKVTVGETVFAIGNPMRIRLTATRGIISKYPTLIAGLPYIQTDTAVNPGNSGGALINLKGQLIGIVSNKMTNTLSPIEGMGFAIPADEVQAFLNQK